MPIFLLKYTDCFGKKYWNCLIFKNKALADGTVCMYYVHPNKWLPHKIELLFWLGAEVIPHQDSTFLYNDPMSLVGYWFPVDDATLENGCLWYLINKYRLIKNLKILKLSLHPSPALNWINTITDLFTIFLRSRHIVSFERGFIHLFIELVSEFTYKPSYSCFLLNQLGAVGYSVIVLCGVTNGRHT